MNKGKQLLRLKEEIEEHNNKLLKLEGKKEELENQLNNLLKKYNISKSNVHEFLKKLQKDIDRKEKEVEKGIREIKEDLCL